MPIVSRQQKKRVVDQIALIKGEKFDLYSSP